MEHYIKGNVYYHYSQGCVLDHIAYRDPTDGSHYNPPLLNMVGPFIITGLILRWPDDGWEELFPINAYVPDTFVGRPVTLRLSFQKENGLETTREELSSEGLETIVAELVQKLNPD
jgi:hypothetical protein